MWNNGKWLNGDNNDNTIDLRFQNPFDVRDNAFGDSGNDTIYGNVADNILDGGSGNDRIYGSWGNDDILGGNGSDYLSGQEGDDSISGGSGDDTLDGGSGIDSLSGGSGSDLLMGGDGNDYLYGGDGDDTLYGDQADANLGSGIDYLDGGAGNDTLQGGGGSDELRGGTGDDTLYGGGGNDLLYGQGGNNTMHGGDGDDKLFVDGSGHNYVNGDGGSDTINVTAYQLSNSDTIIQGGSGVDTLALTYPGTATTFSFGAYVDGIESIKLGSGNATPETLSLSFRDIINVSPHDKLVIDGESTDTLNLSSFVSNDKLSGGHWEQGVQFHMQDSSGVVQAYDHYDYTVGNQVYASLDVDSDIHVNELGQLHLIVATDYSLF